MINFILVFLTTFYLTREDVGNYDLLLVTMSLVTPLVTLQLTDSILRWLLEDHSVKTRKDIISSISVILFGTFSLLGIILFVLNWNSTIPYSIELYLLILLQSIFLVNQQFVRGIGDNRTYVASGIWYSFSYAIFAILALAVFNLKVHGMIYANILAILFINIYVLIKNNIYQYFSFEHIEKAFIKKLLQYSLPLIPNSLSWWAVSSLNRYLILFFLGVNANGLFAISSKIPTVLVVFNSIFNMSWQEKAITTFDHKNKSKYYGDTHDKYLNLIFGIGLVVVATNKLAIQLMVSKDFYEAWLYTPLLIIGVIFSALSGFFGSIYLSEKRTTHLLTSSIIGGGITAIAAYITLPWIGLQGASLSVMLGYLAIYVIRLIGLRSRLNIKINLQVLARNLLIITLISIVSYSEPLWVQALNIAISCFLAIWINRPVLNSILGQVKSRFSSKNPPRA